MLAHVAEHGLAETPAKWTHPANKEQGIDEFIKGDLRLMFFKGNGRQIVVCTVGGMKKGQKADKQLVSQSAKLKDAYEAAGTNIEVITDEDA